VSYFVVCFPPISSFRRFLSALATTGTVAYLPETVRTNVSHCSLIQAPNFVFLKPEKLIAGLRQMFDPTGELQKGTLKPQTSAELTIYAIAVVGAKLEEYRAAQTEVICPRPRNN
jgi:hypothetical protein